MKTFPLHEAIKAQQALRKHVNLAPEQFHIPEFVGMISDEIEALRKQGLKDEQIVEVIQKNSAIEITPGEISENYAPPEERLH